MRTIAKAGLALAVFLLATTSWAWDPDEVKEYDAKAQTAIAEFKEKDPSIERFFNEAAGYVVIPTVGKGGFGIGGARGKGLLYENGAPTAVVTLTQLTVGFQAGGQQYTQVMFFENKEALDNFTNGKFKFSSEASAVILESGASANIAYKDGVAALIESEKGAMFEASLGTQKFKFE